MQRSRCGAKLSSHLGSKKIVLDILTCQLIVGLGAFYPSSSSCESDGTPRRHKWRKFDASCGASLDDPVQWKVFDPVGAPLPQEEAHIHQMLEVTLQCPLGGAAAIAGSV